MKSFKKFLIEKIDITDIITDAREIVEQIIISHSNRILQNLSTKIDKSSQNYNQVLLDSWKKYIGYGTVSALYLKDIKKHIEINLEEHVRKDFPNIKSINLKINFRDRDVVGIGGSFAVGYDMLSMNFSFERLAEIIKRDVATFIEKNEDSNYTEFATSKLENFVKNFISTYSHEVQHYFQYLSKESKNPDSTLPQRSYVTDKKNLTDTISREVKTWTREDWENYLADPIEIDANAAGVAAKIIQEVNKQYKDDAEMQIDELKWILGSLKYNVEHEENLKLYFNVIKNKADDKQYAKVWQRFLKKIYQKVTYRIDKLKERV